MANICEYKVRVKGTPAGCYAFFGGMPCLDDKDIDNEIIDENGICTLDIWGDCKWAVDCYCKSHPDAQALELPEDKEAAFNMGENFWDCTVQDKSKMFDVEVWCNSADIDDFMGEYPEHYNRGVEVKSEEDAEIFKELKVESDWNN